MKKILFAFLALTLLAVGCKKDDSIAIASLQGKWSVVNLRYIETDQGIVIMDDNYTGIATDYLDFKSDNKVHISIDGSMDILDYQLLPNNKVDIDGEEFTIQLLTNNAARLYIKTVWSPDEYTEVTINLKK